MHIVPELMLNLKIFVSPNSYELNLEPVITTESTVQELHLQLLLLEILPRLSPFKLRIAGELVQAVCKKKMLILESLRFEEVESTNIKESLPVHQ